MTNNRLMELAAAWEDGGHIYAVKRDYEGRCSWYLKIVTLHHFQDAELAYAFRKMYGGHVSIRRDSYRAWTLTAQGNQWYFLKAMRDQIPNSLTGPLIDSALAFLKELPGRRRRLAEIIRITNLRTTELRKVRIGRHK